MIPSKREITTDIGIFSTDFTRKKYAKSAPPEQAGPKSTYLPPASCCVKTFCYPFGFYPTFPIDPKKAVFTKNSHS